MKAAPVPEKRQPSLGGAGLAGDPPCPALGGVEVLGHLRDGLSFGQEAVGLAELPSDLFGSLASFLHVGPSVPGLRESLSAKID